VGTGPNIAVTKGGGAPPLPSFLDHWEAPGEQLWWWRGREIWGEGGGEVGEESPPVSLESDAGAKGHFKFIAI
jgi:hypothetical protein